MAPRDIRTLLHEVVPPVPDNPARTVEVERRARLHRRRVHAASAVALASFLTMGAVSAMSVVGHRSEAPPARLDITPPTTAAPTPFTWTRARGATAVPLPAKSQVDDGSPIGHLVSGVGGELTAAVALSARDLAGDWDIQASATEPAAKNDGWPQAFDPGAVVHCLPGSEAAYNVVYEKHWLTPPQKPEQSTSSYYVTQTVCRFRSVSAAHRAFRDAVRHDAGSQPSAAHARTLLNAASDVSGRLLFLTGYVPGEPTWFGWGHEGRYVVHLQVSAGQRSLTGGSIYAKDFTDVADYTTIDPWVAELLDRLTLKAAGTPRPGRLAEPPRRVYE